MIYEGNPMRVRFAKPNGDILQSAVEKGAGHHWSIAYGDFSREFELLARFFRGGVFPIERVSAASMRTGGLFVLGTPSSVRERGCTV